MTHAVIYLPYPIPSMTLVLVVIHINCSHITAGLMLKNSFSERSSRLWNSLPAKPEHFRSLATFNRFVHCIDLSRFASFGF
jgi:hypothetical protein